MKTLQQLTMRPIWLIFLAITTITTLTPTRAHAQSSGINVDECNSQVSYNSGIESTVCVYGSSGAIDTTVEVDSQDTSTWPIVGAAIVLFDHTYGQWDAVSSTPLYDSWQSTFSYSDYYPNPTINDIYLADAEIYGCQIDTSGDTYCLWNEVDDNEETAQITPSVEVLDPAYKVVSILYATPGDLSSDQFTNSTTNGTTTTIGSSTSVGVSDTFSVGFGKADSFGVSFGISNTQSNSSAFTETLSDASSIGNASNGSSPNTVDHNQDLLLVWLNPEITLTGAGGGINYSIATPTVNGSPQLVDDVEVYASALQNIQGASHVPAYALNMQYDAATGQYDLPGLAGVCAHLIQAEYLNGTCTQGDQCGCTPSDFAGILATDPLVVPTPSQSSPDMTTASNPMNVDTSGASACGLPSQSSSSKCRYVPVPASPGSSIQQVTLLAGPTSQGGGRPINSYTQTDSTSTTNTLGESTSESVGYTVKAGFGIFSLQSSTTWTWTDSESTGTINGHSNQIGYSLSSNSLYCYQDVLVYEDTVFHTFVTQQAPGNTSCP